MSAVVEKVIQAKHLESVVDGNGTHTNQPGWITIFLTIFGRPKTYLFFWVKMQKKKKYPDKAVSGWEQIEIANCFKVSALRSIVFLRRCPTAKN